MCCKYYTCIWYNHEVDVFEVISPVEDSGTGIFNCTGSSLIICDSSTLFTTLLKISSADRLSSEYY